MSKSEARELGLHPTATARDIAYYRARAREREAAEAKTARLRALRLAKDQANGAESAPPLTKTES